MDSSKSGDSLRIQMKLGAGNDRSSVLVTRRSNSGQTYQQLLEGYILVAQAEGFKVLDQGLDRQEGKSLIYRFLMQDKSKNRLSTQLLILLPNFVEIIAHHQQDGKLLDWQESLLETVELPK